MDSPSGVSLILPSSDISVPFEKEYDLPSAQSIVYCSFFFFTYLNNVLQYGFFSRLFSSSFERIQSATENGRGTFDAMAGMFDDFELQVELRCNTGYL